MASHTQPEYNRLYYLNNKDKIKTNVKLWQTLNKNKVNISSRKSKLKNKYGISLEDLFSLKQRQNNVCAICESEENLCVDHSHETGKVRGLLCHNCNKGLGFFEDNIAILNSAIDYLRNKE